MMMMWKSSKGDVEHRVGEFILTGIEDEERERQNNESGRIRSPTRSLSQPIVTGSVAGPCAVRSMPASYTNNERGGEWQESGDRSASSQISHTRYVQTDQSRDLAADLTRQSGCGAH